MVSFWISRALLISSLPLWDATVEHYGNQICQLVESISLICLDNKKNTSCKILTAKLFCTDAICSSPSQRSIFLFPDLLETRIGVSVLNHFLVLLWSIKFLFLWTCFGEMGVSWWDNTLALTKCSKSAGASLGSIQPEIALPAMWCLFNILIQNNSSSNQGGKIMFYSMNEQTLPCHILKFFLQKIVDRADFYISQFKFISGSRACSA